MCLACRTGKRAIGVCDPVTRVTNGDMNNIYITSRRRVGVNAQPKDEVSVLFANRFANELVSTVPD